MQNEPANIRFSELKKVCTEFFGNPRLNWYEFSGHQGVQNFHTSSRFCIKKTA